MRHPVKFPAVYDRAADCGVVAVHVLGCGMGHDIRSPFDRTAVNRGGKCVVDDERNTVRVRGFGETLDVKYHKGRVGDGLAEYSLGIGTECLLQFLITAVGINECKFYPHLPHCDVEKIVGAAVYSGSAHNMVAAGSDIEYAEEIGSLAGRSQHAGCTALESGDLGSDHIVGGILQTRIEISLCLKIEQLAHIFAGVIFKSGTLNDRDHSGITVIRRITGLNTFGFSFHSFFTSVTVLFQHRMRETL